MRQSERPIVKEDRITDFEVKLQKQEEVADSIRAAPLVQFNWILWIMFFVVAGILLGISGYVIRHLYEQTR